MPTTTMRSPVRLCSLAALLLAGGIAALPGFGCKKEDPPTPPPTQPATAPSTKTAVAKKPTEKTPEKPPFVYIDAVKANVPAFSATQPLVLPVDLPQAAHLLIKDPVYLDSRLLLWVTRPEAAPTPQVLGKPNEEAEYVVPERVLFVHWWIDNRDRNTPRIVAPASDGNGFEYVAATGRRPIPGNRDWRWSEARAIGNSFLVPTPTGVSVFKVADDRDAITEQYQDLTGGAAAGGATAKNDTEVLPQILYDGQGYLCWLPAQKGAAPGKGAARFLNGQWQVLGPEQGWPEKIVHLIPLVGGSVMQFVPTEEGNVKLNVSPLDTQPLDRKAIERLVIDLAAASEKSREKAFLELTRYGPGVRPILKELMEDQPPEAQGRMRQLLAAQVKPLLGPMSMLGDKLQVVTRHHDGGAVFFAEAGVEMTDFEGEKHPIAPAWLSVRPGRPVQLLQQTMVTDLKPETAQVVAVESHDDDWVVVSDAGGGPRRFVGNDFVRLLRKSEADYTRLVGVDRRGRWLFRKPTDDTQTLVLDPTLPDPTPRLPVWNYANAEEVGWDKDGWPAIKQAGVRSRLKEFGWVGFEESETLLTTAPETPPTPLADTATTGPATGPTTKFVELPVSAALLIGKDGTRYYDGVETLRYSTRYNGVQTWPLPGTAAGKPPARLLQTKDGRLYLFNQPGRVLRIKATPTEPQPFVVEATFARGIPTVEEPTRIWLDPAGRIIIAYEKKLAILFPEGNIPQKIGQLMVEPWEEEDQ